MNHDMKSKMNESIFSPTRSKNINLIHLPNKFFHQDRSNTTSFPIAVNLSSGFQSIPTHENIAAQRNTGLYFADFLFLMRR